MQRSVEQMPTLCSCCVCVLMLHILSKRCLLTALEMVQLPDCTTATPFLRSEYAVYAALASYHALEGLLLLAMLSTD